MAKTYGTVTTFSSGAVLAAAQLNVAGVAVNNLVVPAAVRCVRTTALSITSGAFVALNFDATATYDTDTMLGATKTYLTVNTPGIYSLTATAGFAANATGARAIIFCLNPTLSGTGDTTTITSSTRIGGELVNSVGSAGAQSTLSIAATYSFAAADRMALLIYQNSGGGLAVDSTDGLHFAMTWIGRTA